MLTFINNFPDVYYDFLMMTVLSKPVEFIIVCFLILFKKDCI